MGETLSCQDQQCSRVQTKSRTRSCRKGLAQQLPSLGRLCSTPRIVVRHSQAVRTGTPLEHRKIDRGEKKWLVSSSPGPVLFIDSLRKILHWPKTRHINDINDIEFIIVHRYSMPVPFRIFTRPSEPSQSVPQVFFVRQTWWHVTSPTAGRTRTLADHRSDPNLKLSISLKIWVWINTY
jgi:hypothetical protein